LQCRVNEAAVKIKKAEVVIWEDFHTDKDGNPAPDSWNPLCDIRQDGKIDEGDWDDFLKFWMR